MAKYQGYGQTLEHKLVDTYARFDKVNAQATWEPEGGELEFEEGVGGQISSTLGEYTPQGSAQTEVQSIGLMACALPAEAYALPPAVVAIQGGVVGVALAHLWTTCYIRQLELSCANGGNLQASYDWRALEEDDLHTIASAAEAIANSPIAWHGAASLLEVPVGAAGAAFNVMSWTARLVNEFSAQFDQDTAADTIFPSWYEPGGFYTELDLELRTPPGVSLLVTAGTAIGFSWAADDVETIPKTFTLDMTGGEGLYVRSRPRELQTGPNGVTWRLTARSKPWDIATWAVTFAA